uniref:PCI domain-containing protein n=1 Tax=Meloidogyne floridensis TaxID=298350 RepID=A0A915NVF1_9BILA
LCLKARYFDNIEPFLKIDVTQLLKQSYSAVSFQTSQQQQQIVSEVTSTDNSNASTTQQQQPPQSSTTTAPTNSSSLTSTAVSFLQKAVNTVSGTFGNPKSDVPCNKPTLQTIVLFNRRSILLYFYYGALIYGALEKWEDSCLFLELLPSYRTPSLNRNYYHYALVYIRLPHLIEKALEAKKDLVVVLENFLNDKIAVFSKDQNVGLMKVLINVSRENALKRLENIFVSLQLNDVCRLAHMPSNFNNDGSTITNVEQLILSLRLKNKINAQIDDLTQTVIFEEEVNENKNKDEENIDEAMNEIIELSKIIRSFNDVIRLNPNFIEKGIQRSKSVGGGCSTSMTVGGGGGGNNGGGGASNLRNDGIFGVNNNDGYSLRKMDVQALFGKMQNIGQHKYHYYFDCLPEGEEEQLQQQTSNYMGEGGGGGNFKTWSGGGGVSAITVNNDELAAIKNSNENSDLRKIGRFVLQKSEEDEQPPSIIKENKINNGRELINNLINNNIKERSKYFDDILSQQNSLTIFQQYARFHNQFGIRHVLLILLLVLYAIFGGLMFQAIERDNEIENNISMIFFIQPTSKQSEKINEIIVDGYTEMLKIEGRYIGSVFHKYETLALSNVLNWYFGSSVFYAMTLFTTIGYGTIACQTALGKFSVWHSNDVNGTWGCWPVNTWISFVLPRWLLRAYVSDIINEEDIESKIVEKNKLEEGEGEEEEEELSLSLLLPIVAIYILFVSTIVSLLDWSKDGKLLIGGLGFGDAFYFSFLSLATIGLGDVMPYNLQYTPLLAFLFLAGLALLSLVNSTVYLCSPSKPFPCNNGLFGRFS